MCCFLSQTGSWSWKYWLQANRPEAINIESENTTQTLLMLKTKAVKSESFCKMSKIFSVIFGVDEI